MLRNESVPVSTVDNVEFVQLTPSDISPLVSKCEIKVMYVGKNRNGSYIDKPTAIKMAKSLRMTPIVGAYRQDIEDFGDHGSVIHIEDGEVKFSCKTVPYGFVAPDADVWFQKFDDVNDMGESITREYMMTTGYLWTGQYPEIEKCIQEGQGQSMEIDDVDGHWSQDKDGIEFFIINDAIFTKLCVLGDDVEPCFEGASVTSPEVSETFAMYRNDFSHTLFAMMNELKHALKNEGGLNMPQTDEAVAEETVEEVAPAEEFVEEAQEETAAVEEVATAEDGVVAPEDSFAKEDKKDEGEDDTDTSDDSKSNDSSDDAPEDKKGPKDGEDKKQHSLENEVSDLTDKLQELTDKFAALEKEAQELRDFKAERISADKDALIGKYHMLSDEDKADIIANKDKFSLSEIESQLALLYVKKNVDFDSIDGQIEEEHAPLTTFSLDDDKCAEDADPILSALREVKNN